MLKQSCVLSPCATDVIHTVGPMARNHVGPNETNDLTSCYQNSLRLVEKEGLRTVVSSLLRRTTWLGSRLSRQNTTEVAKKVVRRRGLSTCLTNVLRILVKAQDAFFFSPSLSGASSGKKKL